MSMLVLLLQPASSASWPATTTMFAARFLFT
jgi:hypothetical protein